MRQQGWLTASLPQVVAIVMDIFTDVDLLFEVLDAAARRVPVYILLDEMNSQLFLDTAAKCRVNLNYVEVSKDLPYLVCVPRGCVLDRGPGNI